MENINLKNLMVESIYDRGLFKAIFFSGIPGSGKSYVLSKITDGMIEPRIVNTDKAIEYFSKQVGDDINTNQYYEYFRDSVKRMTLNQLANNVNGMLPLFIDGTSNSLKSLFKREGILKSFGYDTGMVWIETDLDQAIDRASKRDRHVPPDFIRDVYNQLRKNKEYYRGHFRFFQEIKNGEGELTDSVIKSAYSKVSQFFNTNVTNPVGMENIEHAKQGGGYLVPSVYRTIEDIRNVLSGWYGNY
jgi:shikimate kinase